MEEFIGYAISIVCGGFGGSVLTNLISNHKNRLQKMECYYVEDDILSKIPQKNEENEVQQNLHCKRFRVKNTTNKDLPEFKLYFQFDQESMVVECYSRSKEGYDKQKIRPGRTDKNMAIASIRNFNRGDEIEYTIKVANINKNEYYVTESDCIGFKVICKDVRTDSKKSKSTQSNQVLVVKH